MKRARFMATVALAGAGAMTIAAQETRTPAGGNTTGDQNRTTQQTPTTQTPSSQAAAGTTTITGCIQSSGEGAARTYTLMANAAGTASGAASGATAGSGASSTSGAGATAGARTEGAAGQSSRAGMTTYTLEGNEVAKHVGHQVEVTGTLASSTSGDRASNTTGAAGGNDRSSAVGTSGADGDRQRLRVTSVKMLSTTCSR